MQGDTGKQDRTGDINALVIVALGIGAEIFELTKATDGLAAIFNAG